MKLIITTLILLGALQAETIELEPITITGDAIGDSNKEYTIMKPLEIVESSVVIQETIPGFKNPVIHGLMGDKVLLTIDGIKFSNSLFRSGPNQYYSWIPDEFVVRAKLDDPLSVITSSALGGSIDRDIGVDKSKVGVSFNTANKGHTEVIKYKDDTSQIAILNKNTSNVTTPDGEVQHSSYNQKGFLLGFKTKDFGETKVVFTQTNDVDRTDKFENNQYYVYELQQYALISHKYFVPDTTFMIMPSFQQFKEKIDRDDITKNVDSTNNIFGLQLLGYYEPSFLEDSYFSYGLVDNFEDINYATGINTNTYDYNTLSAYLTYYAGIGRKFDYELRYKYSAMSAKGSGLDRNLDNHAVGIDSKYKIGFLHNIFASANLNYKFPTITNLAEARDDSVTEIANPDLQQERAITVKVGYTNDGFTTSVFYKKLYDMIIREETNIPDGIGGNKWKYQNSDDGRIYGIDIEFDKKFDNGWGVYAYAEYLDGKTDYDYISKLVPFHTEAKLQYKPYYVEWKYAPSVSEDKMALKDKVDIRINNHNEGYSIFNIGYKKVYNKIHDVELKLKNILNSTGRVYGSSVDFGERGVYISYAYQF